MARPSISSLPAPDRVFRHDHGPVALPIRPPIRPRATHRDPVGAVPFTSLVPMFRAGQGPALLTISQKDKRHAR